MRGDDTDKQQISEAHNLPAEIDQTITTDRTNSTNRLN